MSAVNTGARPAIDPVTPAVGAVVTGVGLGDPLEEGTVSAIRQALLDHHVVFFRDQRITREDLVRFAAVFGTPIPLWASMCAAYEALSKPMRSMLDWLTTVHSVEPVVERMGPRARAYAEYAAQTYGHENVHPVVLVHPDNGRRALFVNQGWTTRIVELTRAESDHLLALLFEHLKSPDFGMRWRWKVDDVAIWDNREAIHYAVADYDVERVMQRMALSGEGQVPTGPRPMTAVTAGHEARTGR